MNNYPAEPSRFGKDFDADEQAALILLEFSRSELRFPAVQPLINQEDTETVDVDDVDDDAGILVMMKNSNQAIDLPYLPKFKEGNVVTRSPAHKHAAQSSSEDDLTFAPEPTSRTDNSKPKPTLRRRVYKKVSPDPDYEDEYLPSQYHRNRLDAPTDWVRRSTRKTQSIPSPPSNALPSLWSSPPPALPSSQHRRSPKQEPGEGFMPSADNDFKFKYDSPTGRTAAELDDLFKLPAHPKQLPTDLRGLKISEIKMSYRQLGAMPKEGLAKELIAKMEAEHQNRAEENEKEELAKNGDM